MTQRLQDRLFVSTTFAEDGTAIGDVLDLCVAHGVIRVELGSNHRFEPDPAATVGARRVETLTHNYFPPPEYPFVVNLASTDEAIRHQSLDHARHCIDFCACAGSRLYTFHPGFLSDPQPPHSGAASYDFLFEEPLKGTYGKAFEYMLTSVSELVAYARLRAVPIAVETEGSVTRWDQLLLQRPEELRRLLGIVSDGLGVAVNVGHLNLARRAWGFEVEEFLRAVSEHVVAFELSHNEGHSDDHLPLREDTWYWDVLSDPRFRDAFLILEYRNVPIETVRTSMEFVRHHLGEDDV